MPASSIRYGFSQHFSVSAVYAYKWSTDYQSDDHPIMGIEGKRRIRIISEDTIILMDTVTANGQEVEKRKLIRLNAPRLSWTNTHL